MKNKKLNYQAVFFDFDGVILDSVNVKTNAFAQMFSQYGDEIQNAAVDYHVKHGGVSRFEKFKYYYNTLLKKSIDQKTIDSLSKQFSDLVLQGVLNAPFICGAKEALEKLKYNKTPAFVVSGTPDSEVKYIVEKRGLGSFFVSVHGSPAKKDEIVLKLSKKHDLDLLQCLFIGDAVTDYEAAKATGTDFLGIVKLSESSPFPADTKINSKVVIEGLSKHV